MYRLLERIFDDDCRYIHRSEGHRRYKDLRYCSEARFSLPSARDYI